MQNWAEDLYFKQLDLNYPDVTDAMVGDILSHICQTMQVSSEDCYMHPVNRQPLWP